MARNTNLYIVFVLQIKGFPAEITSVDQLEEVITRIIWDLVGQHASLNYELNDYANYLPNMPSKTYTVKGIDNDTFTYETFGNKLTTVVSNTIHNTRLWAGPRLVMELQLVT